MLTESQEFQEGWKSAVANPNLGNPYNQGSLENLAWTEGYKAGNYHIGKSNLNLPLGFDAPLNFRTIEQIYSDEHGYSRAIGNSWDNLLAALAQLG